MLSQNSTRHQPNLFYNDLLAQLDLEDPLIKLGEEFPWSMLEKDFKQYYKSCGRPSKPIRLMVGLLLLKYLENLSDEQVVLHWKRNPYYQYFCGFTEFKMCLPCDSSELTKFRNRIGKSGVEKIFKASVILHGESAYDKEVHIDTTVQEKNITYPTDGKLAIKIINRVIKLAKTNCVKQRRTYKKEVKDLRLKLRNFRHPKRRSEAKRAMKRLRTIAKILIREAERKLPATILDKEFDNFTLYRKVLSQQPKDKNKIYSLHEKEVYCVGKGKDHVQYEYGSKASIVSTAKKNIIVGVASHSINQHDSKTLDGALASVSKTIGVDPEIASCDRGYRGVTQIGNTKINLPNKGSKKDTRYQRDKNRTRCRRRAAIEPVIGHLKSDYRLGRNFLKGVSGDIFNLHMAASAWNLRKWIIEYFCSFIVQTLEKILKQISVYIFKKIFAAF